MLGVEYTGNSMSPLNIRLCDINARPSGRIVSELAFAVGLAFWLRFCPRATPSGKSFALRQALWQKQVPPQFGPRGQAWYPPVRYFNVDMEYPLYIPPLPLLCQSGYIWPGPNMISISRIFLLHFLLFEEKIIILERNVCYLGDLEWKETQKSSKWKIEVIFHGGGI